MNKLTYISILTATLLFTACTDAGNDQVVLPGSLVTLEGEDGDDIKSIEWEQISGPTVELSDTTIANPTFVAPLTDDRIEIEFESVVERIRDQNSTDETSDEGMVELFDSYFDIANIFADAVKITVKHNDKILNATTSDSNEVRSFSRDNVNEIVHESVNNLYWSDTTHVQKTYEDADYGNEYINYFLNDTAESYCASLSLDSKEWRLPNFRELQTLVNYNQYDAVTDSAFSVVASGNYVSKISNYLDKSVLYLFGTPTYKSPRSIDFRDGQENAVEKTTNTYVRCVSGEQLETYSFVKELNSSVVLDPTNKLLWQDVVQDNLDYSEAQAYCADSNMSGFGDWRLPSINELVTTIDYHEDPKDATNNTFDTRSFTSYISSTTYANDSSLVWIVNLSDLTKLESQDKTIVGGVRCVRESL